MGNHERLAVLIEVKAIGAPYFIGREIAAKGVDQLALPGKGDLPNVHIVHS
jgi:hypothetical protein